MNDKDQLKIGPLAFAVKIERPVPVSKPTPLPTSSKAKDSDDDVAEMLLALGDEGTSPPAGGDKDGVPQGSTVMDLPSPFSQTDSNEPLPPDGAPAEKKKEKAKPEYGNTQTAAKAILEKYTRRQRT